MSGIMFTKMQGAGNDFIMIDNRSRLVADVDKPAFARRYCPRALAVGADGVIFLEEDAELDFAWSFWNSDGSEAEMCGNGARCAAVFAHRLGVAGTRMRFRTLAGVINAQITPAGARVGLTDAGLPRHLPALAVEGEEMELFFINTGVPHAVIPVDDLEAVDLPRLGRAIRFHPEFSPAGTNVDFLGSDSDGRIAMRTYERGCEGETLACGTGAVACAVVAAKAMGLRTPVRIRTRSGSILSVDFTMGPERVSGVSLEGPAQVVYEGELECR